MSLVYVTGVSGVGKSAVCTELRRRGYDAHDSDRDGNATWVDRESGITVPTDPEPRPRSARWLEQYEWRLLPERVQALAADADGRVVFLCGSTANEREVWHHFSQVIYLAVDEATLRRRLETRTSNHFGKTADELAAILEWRTVGPEQYRAFGATVIDATRPLESVVRDVIDLTEPRGSATSP